MNRVVFAAALTLAAFGPNWSQRPAAHAAEPVACERRLPRDAAMYVSCRSVAEFRARWQETALIKLSENEALAEARAAFSGQMEELSREIEGVWGIPLAELLGVPQGELAAAWSPRPGAPPQAVVMLDFGDKRDAVQKLLDKLGEFATGEGERIRSEEEFQETHLVLFQPRPDAEQDERQPLISFTSFGYFLRDTFLVLGTSPDALKGVLARWDGTSDEVFGEGAVYRYAIDRCRDPQAETRPLVSWFIDPLAVFRAGMAAQQPAAEGVLQMFLPGLGIDGFRGIAGTFDLPRGDFDMISRTLVYLEPPWRGLLSLLQFDPVPHAPPRWVTAETSGYLAFNWNLSRVYAGVVALADRFLGPGGAERYLAQFSEQAGLGDFQLRRDLLDPLSGKVHVVTESRDSEGELSEAYLVAAELKDAALLRATLRKLTQAPLPIKERQFQGESIYEIETAGDDEPGPALALGFAIAENHLMFASDVRLLETVLRGAEGRDPLADSAIYRRVAGRFPEVTQYISFDREDDSVRSLLARLRFGAMQGGLGADGDALLSRLPSYESLKKHLPAAGGYMEPDERGLKITGFSLKVDPE